MNQSSHLDEQLNSHTPAAALSARAAALEAAGKTGAAWIVGGAVAQLPHVLTAEQLQKNVADTARLYGEAAALETEAWREYDAAIDLGYSIEVKNDLFAHCQQAVATKKIAQASFWAAQADLLDFVGGVK
jgi:hypothetical protein